MSKIDGRVVDDFGEPTELLFEFLHRNLPKTVRFDREAFVWRDRLGVEYKLSAIDDVYLTNIINFLSRRITVMDVVASVHWSMVRSFLLEEARARDVEVFCG